MYVHGGVFYGLPDYSMTVRPEFLQEVIDFAEVTGVAANIGPNDSAAVLFDSAGDDTMTGTGDGGAGMTARLFGTGFNNIAHNFDAVYGVASLGGVDTATFDASPPEIDDTFYGGDAYSALVGTDYLLQAQGFDLVHANLIQQNGNDTAILIDSPGNDQLTANGNFAELTYASGNRVRVTAFDTVFAYGTSGGTNTRSVTNPLAYTLTFVGTWVGN
jgi:hypothetical protein